MDQTKDLRSFVYRTAIAIVLGDLVVSSQFLPRSVFLACLRALSGLPFFLFRTELCLICVQENHTI